MSSEHINLELASVWSHAGTGSPVECGTVTREEIGSAHYVSKFRYAENNNSPLNPGFDSLETTYSTTLLRGNFSTFLDVCPGAWGRRVRMLEVQPTGQLSELLLGVHDQVGSLSFTPHEETPGEIFNGYEAVHLGKMLKLSRAFEGGERFWRNEQRFITNLGGVRPKFTVVTDGDQWIAKLPSVLDAPLLPSNPRLEAAVLELAKICNLNVPEFRMWSIDNRDVLLVKRFDRTLINNAWSRHRYASLRSIFHSKPGVQQYVLHGSYQRFARELDAWSVQPAIDKHELFKRIAFNCLVSNTDDHDLNHGVIDTGAGFRLSPLFDVVPQARTGRRAHLVLSLGDLGTEATYRNLISDCEVFGLTKADAAKMIEGLECQIEANWRHCLDKFGFLKKQQDLMSYAFCPGAFRNP